MLSIYEGQPHHKLCGGFAKLTNYGELGWKGKFGKDQKESGYLLFWWKLKILKVTITLGHLPKPNKRQNMTGLKLVNWE